MTDFSSIGSPPQVRGKLPPQSCDRYAKRITPAGAGKTRKLNARSFASTDHPRRCGENSRRLMVSRLSSGSPPQVRGKLFNKIREAMPPGITPAGAGKTDVDMHQVNASRDHPRRCGENADGLSRIESPTGSPPQVRGKRIPETAQTGVRRITPAGAGKTQAQQTSPQEEQDHPRRCGENLYCRKTDTV